MGKHHRRMDADVIVIGAGAAGLAAARRLAQHKQRVVLLEARDRVGGRAWTLERSGARMEMGAEFIHGEAALTHRLMSEAALPWESIDGSMWREDPGGTLIREEDSFESDDDLFAGLHSIDRDISVAEYLERLAGDEAMRPRIEMAYSFIEGFDAADPQIASAHGISHEWASGVDSSSGRPAHGYGALMQFLHDACEREGVRTLFNHPVRSISWNGKGVTVDDLHAGTCVVTLPSQVLRAPASPVRFEPPLPEEKQRALRFIETGDVAKVLLHFSSRFWEQIDDGKYADALFFRPSGGPFGVYWIAARANGPVVTAWAGGPRAARLLASPQNGLVESALNGFARLLGDERAAREAFVAGTIHNWSADPFALGAYTYLRTGAGDAREILAAPLSGTLFFAGEATCSSGHSGTVDGALETGERAADEVMRNA